MGLTTMPIFYDKAALDASGVPSVVVDLPDSVRKAFGGTFAALIDRGARLVATVGGGKGLVVDNRGIPEAILLRNYSHTSFVGVTLLRQ